MKPLSSIFTRALLACVAAIGFGQSTSLPAQQKTPDFRLQVWGEIETDFNSRVQSYVDLRRELEQGLPALSVTAEPAAIWRAERALANRIRVARSGARQGDIFTSPISAQFKWALRPHMNATTWLSIMDDNPGEFAVRINDSYPEGKPLSTMPARILAALPELPEDIEYRFVNVDLILLDTRASLVLDRIPHAIQRPDAMRIRQ